MAATTYMKLDAIPYELSSERLVLRSFDPRRRDEARRLFEAIDESRENLSRHMSWADRQNRIEDVATWIRDARARFEAMHEFAFGLFARDDGRLLGGAGLHIRGEPDPIHVEIGYWTRTSELRRGWALEGASMLTGAALERLEAQRVVIRTDVDNAPSRAIPERLGYRFEGIAQNGLRTRGVPRDAAIYARVPG